MKRMWLLCGTTLATLMFALAIARDICYVPDIQHKAKFLSGQCFVKQGLREPWDLDVGGRIIIHGYTKYLVMYADEANRVSGGTKQGWEEDIQTFDAKYQVALCPETWKTHTHLRDFLRK